MADGEFGVFASDPDVLRALAGLTLDERAEEALVEGLAQLRREQEDARARGNVAWLEAAQAAEEPLRAHIAVCNAMFVERAMYLEVRNKSPWSVTDAELDAAFARLQAAEVAEHQALLVRIASERERWRAFGRKAG